LGCFWIIASLAGADYSVVVSIDYKAFMERRQQVCGGEPVVRGTRVTVRTILASLAEGASVEQILIDFPTVSREAVQAMIAFAAASAEDAKGAKGISGW
jgi:uncharacterized protein (DUF433 family)